MLFNLSLKQWNWFQRVWNVDFVLLLDYVWIVQMISPKKKFNLLIKLLKLNRHMSI